MKRVCFLRSLLFLVLALMLIAGCGGSDAGPEAAAPLSADNINLIFVVSPDLAHNAEGDIHPDTANLTNQGLQRSLLMATYLKRHVLGTNNVTGIYALAPMTHLQTANHYPDMAAIGYIQHFALLNQITIKGTTAQTILLAWEREHYPPLVTYLIESYGGTVPVPPLPWPQDDYDTLWTVTLDAQGNLTVNNALCEGIDSASLPPTAPQF